MAREPKYDTEHLDEIFDMLVEGVEKIEKEVNEKFPYHEVKPHTTVSGPGDAFNTLEGDAFSVKTRLGVTCEDYIPKGYKKRVAMFNLNGVVEISDLLLHQEDKTKPYGTAQLKPMKNIRDKELIYYGPYPDRTKFIHDEYEALCKKVEKTILDKYGTKCVCNQKPLDGRKVSEFVYKKGSPEQYKEYFVSYIKSNGYNINHYIVKDAKNDYGVTITQADLDASPVKKMYDPLDEIKGLSEEEIHKLALKKELEAKTAKEEKEKREKEQEEEAKKYIEKVEKKEEVKPVEKKKSRFQQWREDRELNKLLDDVLDLPKEKKKKVKKEKSYSSSGIKGFFSKLWSVITAPFIWLWEHVGPGIKKVGYFIWAIIAHIGSGIAIVASAIGRGLSKLFYGVTSGDVIFIIVPVIISITLAIFSITGLIDLLGWKVSADGTLFGYDFELSGMALGWFEDTDHNFFTAITLGLVQLLLILLSYVGDLILHLVFLVVSLLWALIQLILQIALQYLLPIAIPVYLLVKLILGDRKGIVVAGFIISVICAVCYFTLPYAL